MESFIIDLLSAKIKELDNSLSLADEYSIVATENVVVMKDFIHIDSEGWDDEY